MLIGLCCLGSPGALLLHHDRLLALQNGAGTTQGSLEKQIKTQIKTNCEIQIKRDHHKRRVKHVPDV